MDIQVAKNAAKDINQRWNTLVRRIRQRATYLRHPQYRLLCNEASRLYELWLQDSDDLSRELMHPVWLEVQPFFAQLVSDGVPSDFLRVSMVKGMFYRTGFGQPQQYELTYLRNTSEEMLNLIRPYRESPVGGPVIDCPDLDITVNSLGMLYYITRILEHLDRSKLHTIVEFGGGFGNLCRVFLDLLPSPLTYIIIDIPEMLALQYVYLRGSSHQYQVTAHTSQPVMIQSGSVNLVPVQWAASLSMTSDLFISTFALSEATMVAQTMVIRSGFFGADAIYLVGQHTDAESWHGLALESMAPVRRAVSDSYSNVQLQPFHFADSWELIASRQIKVDEGS